LGWATRTHGRSSCQARIKQGTKNPCSLCAKKLSAGAGTGKCWPWCQKPGGEDAQARADAKKNAVRGLVHLEEAIKAAHGPGFDALKATFEGLALSKLHGLAGRCKPKLELGGLDREQLLERLCFDSHIGSFIQTKVMAKRREMEFEDELEKCRLNAVALERGEDTTKMWHQLTRWEGKWDDKDKGVDEDTIVPAIRGVDERAMTDIAVAKDPLVRRVRAEFAPPPPKSAGDMKPGLKAAKKGGECTGPCCDLNFTGTFDPAKCQTRKVRSSRLKFAETLTPADGGLPKRGFAVPFLVLSDYEPTPATKPGYLTLKKGQTVFVWNESGDPDAKLAKEDDEGRFWLDGWIGHGSEKPLYKEDHFGFGAGIEGFAAGIFPGDCVTKPN
jgi:hypothetical protein